MYRTLLLVVAFVASFSGAPALAQDVAVLEFDGYGVPYDQITRLSRGLQDAFLDEGSYTPVDEFALADRLSAGRASDISEARKLISEARKSLDLGNAAGALRNLEDALRLHEGAGSHIARRPELADAHYLAGDALLRLGRSYDAERHFVWPGELSLV